MVKEENEEIIYSPILVDFGKAKSDVYSIGVVFYRVNKLIKDKNLKEICTKCLALYNERCTSDELRKMSVTLLTPGDGC